MLGLKLIHFSERGHGHLKNMLTINVLVCYDLIEYRHILPLSIRLMSLGMGQRSDWCSLIGGTLANQVKSKPTIELWTSLEVRTSMEVRTNLEVGTVSRSAHRSLDTYATYVRNYDAARHDVWILFLTKDYAWWSIMTIS